ncbi:glycosyltransferase family 2 protein [Tamlana sp. 2_MG-2023]|uniref:glycosyltransferase family 2 protein n=1 Tax=unclassified Tamlana TaxID=2614803 RepID=UPI0026E21C85|nr:MULTISPECIES: glycosyltransferase family 2 protein [unclassified Tamlana]MDO6758766.1 glycosyltransferase family 2 protein [Tamlana sp. 2_MG-2023]MDO6789465.1 glycosyltransferase family 2 protein [Tamlana sp. 1_MG-2023]
MNFSLIICTYMRPEPLLKLLDSVKEQSLYPNEILIIDGSLDTATQNMLESNSFKNLQYFKVDDTHRGLTKQRNFGITKVSKAMEVVCFLDDDTVLEIDYFEKLIGTYNEKQEALAVGGYIVNEVDWNKSDHLNQDHKFYYDGWMRTEPARFKIRKPFGLLPDVPPGFMPTFSHGRSIGFLPPSGNIYPVELIMGGVASYRKAVFYTQNFSNYFEGYGLYEDADFSLRLAKKGKLFVNTQAKLSHYHDASGRPNQYKYGKMVLRNGWYVWRVKYPKPTLKAKFKWHATAFVLTAIRFTNVLTTNKKQEALTESFGRVVGWLSLLFNPPKVKR